MATHNRSHSHSRTNPKCNITKNKSGEPVNRFDFERVPKECKFERPTGRSVSIYVIRRLVNSEVIHDPTRIHLCQQENIFEMLYVPLHWFLDRSGKVIWGSLYNSARVSLDFTTICLWWLGGGGGGTTRKNLTLRRSLTSVVNFNGCCIYGYKSKP
jgi:hypothetical protein